MSEKVKSVYEVLSAINVNDNTDKKGNFTYLSWAWAWAEVKKKYPNASYNIHKYGEDKKPYLYDEGVGYIITTDMTIGGITHEMWLPVMNYKNKAIKEADMMDINKAIMRCLVKNIGMHGLGLYIYAGEDLPEEEQGKAPKKKTTKKKTTTKKTTSKLITDTQIDQIRKYYDEVAIYNKILPFYKVKNINELTLEQASQIISKGKKNAS